MRYLAFLSAFILVLVCGAARFHTSQIVDAPTKIVYGVLVGSAGERGSQQIRLLLSKRTFKNAIELSKYITNRRIVIDADTTQLLYELNPAIRDLNKLNENTILTVFDLPPDLKGFLASKELRVRFRLTEEQRVNLAQILKVLKLRTDDLLGYLKEDNKVPADLKAKMTVTLAEIDSKSATLSNLYIDHKVTPISERHMILLQRLLNVGSAVIGRHADQSNWGSYSTQLLSFSDDLADEANIRTSEGPFAPSSDDDNADVTVTIKNASSDQLKGLRVYYQINFDYTFSKGTPENFQDTSNPSTKNVVVKHYWFWCSLDGKPETKYCAPVELKVADYSSGNDATPVSLLYKKP